MNKLCVIYCSSIGPSEGTAMVMYSIQHLHTTGFDPHSQKTVVLPVWLCTLPTRPLTDPKHLVQRSSTRPYCQKFYSLFGTGNQTCNWLVFNNYQTELSCEHSTSFLHSDDKSQIPVPPECEDLHTDTSLWKEHNETKTSDMTSPNKKKKKCTEVHYHVIFVFGSRR